MCKLKKKNCKFFQKDIQLKIKEFYIFQADKIIIKQK